MSIVATPEVAAGARLWRTAGAHRLTIVVKATFAPAHQQPMTIAPPDPIVVDDTHAEGDASRSVLAASDLAPYLPRGEVLFVGRARSEDAPVPALSVRLAVYGGKPLVEKTLHVVGQRTLADHGANAPEPFIELPIVYEQALRGAMDENPAGIVPSPGCAMPTVLDPDDAAGPAGFGPLSSRWAGRRRLLRQLDPTLLEAAVPELPDAFAWSFFHAAPPDQRCTFFGGDEWVVLDHLWRGHPRLESRLPGARAAARVYDGGSHVEVPLVADTLFIDGNREVCSLVWRGNVAVDPARLRSMEVLAGLELPGRPIPWPGDAAPAVRTASASAAPSTPEPGGAHHAVTSHQSGSHHAVASHQSGSHHAVTSHQSGPHHAVGGGGLPTAPLQPGARSPSSPPTPAPYQRHPSGSHHAMASMPDSPRQSYGIRYPTPPPGTQPAVRTPTPAAFEAPPAGPVDDDGGHTVMRQVDARLLEQLSGERPERRQEVPAAPGAFQVPAAPGAYEDRSESTALFAIPADTTLMKIARGEASSPASQVYGAPATADASAEAPFAEHGVPSQAATARRPTAEHELVDEQTFVHDDAELARLLQDSTAKSSRMGHPAPPAVARSAGPTTGTTAGWPGDPADHADASPPTMATPGVLPLPVDQHFTHAIPTDPHTTDLHPTDAGRRAARATSRGLGPVHVVEAAAVGPDARHDADAGRESEPPSLEATQPGKESLRRTLRDELVRRLASGQSLDDAQLERADLSDLDLSGRSLVRAVLRGARLDRARLDGADLTGARLEGAHLRGASLTGAKLDGAVLDGAVLDGATLLGASLDDASLTGASLAGVIMVDATATRASLREAELRDARFDRARLNGADFERAKLTDATFLGANLAEASFFEAEGPSASFVEANLTGARFDLSHFPAARFGRATASDTLWNEAVLDGASFEAATLAGATFAKASCRGAIFSSAELREARFQRARLEGAVFTGADLEGAVFDTPEGAPAGPQSGAQGESYGVPPGSPQGEPQGESPGSPRGEPRGGPYGGGS